MNSYDLINISPDLKSPELDLIRGDIDALVFDLDGTLLDSMLLWNQVDIEFLSRFGFEVTKEYTDYVKRVSIDQAAIYTKEKFNLPLTPDEIKNTWNQMVFEAYSKTVKIFGGVREYISKAHDMGFKIVAATALTKVNAEAALKSNDILKFFDSLTTLEDLGDGIDKSTPDVYLRAISGINVASNRCLVFEDVEAAIRGAKLGEFKVTCVYDKIGAGSLESWSRMCQISDYKIINWSSISNH